ncbi:VOC family protein [Rhodovulum sp. 12E13]|uniref:VOC family protein n=1 Tax=Rhodovulum sp. 12E13 TaxID=2203891 RepID=UPI000E1986C5|nr:VOC family protein [Rhodovulum sp. 12E13]RDC73659.1 VOC family protein [Rhodovulum sp. 12E13]
MQARIDHLLWAGPDLEAASAAFAELTGVTPATGGSHPGFGTRNALVALDDGRYLEVIAPDPVQDLAGTLGAELAALPAPRMFTIAFAASGLDAVAQAARAAGAAPGAPIDMARTRPDGVHLAWQILRFDDPARGWAMPFVIDWKDTPHPSASTPAGCALSNLVLTDPAPEGLSALVTAIGADVPVARGLAPGAVAELDTPKGRVVLT